MTSEDEYDLREALTLTPETTLSWSHMAESEEDRLHGVIEELTKQVVGLNRMVGWLMMEQNHMCIEIPYSVILALPDTAELVTWKNKMTEGQVIELRGVPGYSA